MAEEPLPFRYVPPVDPNIGRRFGRYVVRTLLGRGGMGAAYLAEHEAQAHVRCVIKFVLAELAQNPMIISRYKTETEAVAVLKHDNIVKLQDFGVLDDGQLFMCFEYIDGQSLDRYIMERGGRLNVRKAAYLIFQLCDALQYAHERGVVHRDLKPDNLMIEASPPGSHLDERVKILDFGIAKVANTSEHTGSGISMGTPRYMAPEQVTNAAAATSAADVFSMATIFYLIVTGKLPWGAPESDVAIYHLQKTEAPAWPSEDVMQRDVAAVVMRALSIKPALRPSMREFGVAIAAAIPREGDLESGTEILKHVKRSWVTSSPPHVQTLPRPAAADPTSSPVPSQAATPEDTCAQVPDGAQGADNLKSELAPTVTDLAITANVRRRSHRGAAGPAANAAVDAAGAIVSAPSPDPEAMADGASPERQTPLLAALPTGLLSQRFAAQEPPIDADGPRRESIIVSSEIETASGTPDPRPYAHAQIPAVVVSNTQLSGLAPTSSRRGAALPAAHEPPPIVVLPHAFRSTARRKVIALSAAACALAALMSFVIVRQRAHGNRSPVPDADHSTARAGVRTTNAAEPGGGSPGSASIAPQAIDSGAAQAPRPPSLSALAPVGARAAPPTPSTVASRSERKPDAPTNRSPDGEANSTSVAKTQRQPPSETASGKSPRVDATRTGKLTILVTPWALVWLDGKPIDQAPAVVDDVPAGRHRLRLKNDIAKKDETTTVTVTAGQTTTVQRTW